MLAALGLSGLAVPALAQDEMPEPCPIMAGAPTEVEGELAAVEAAGACGVEVEVTDQRNEFGTVVALPSGELKAEIGVEPIQALDDSGVWAPIDTTLEITGDGSVRPVNITEDVAFSGGGTSPLAAVGYGAEGSFSLSWPGELPAPVLDGPQAVYTEVMTGVDLVVEATAQGFRYDLVVADAEAAQNPDLEAIIFPVEATGVELTAPETGAVEVTVAGQAEMASGEALMWEAPADHDGTETVPELTAITDTPSDPDQEVAAVEVALEFEDLVLRPDLELLRGEGTRYPVVIDPQWNGGIQDNIWGLVNTKYPDDVFYRGKNASGNDFMSNTGTYGNAGAGQTCDSWTQLDCHGSTYDMRSIFRMDTDTVTQNAYRIPHAAYFKIVQRHSASCSNGAARIWRTGSYNSNDTWDSQPAWYESVTISSANNGANCDGWAWTSFDVTSMVKMAHDAGWANLHLGLRAPDESPSPDLLQWNRFDADTAVLEIFYDIRPYTVKLPQTNGIGCTSTASSAPWITDRTPTLSAQYGSQDSKIKYHVRVRNSTTDAILHEYTSAPVTADTRHPYTVPGANQLGDGLYHWHARSISTTNNAIASDWTTACRIKVDGTKPSPPTVTPGTDAPYAVRDTVTFTLSSTDPTVNSISSGVVRFEYSWGTSTLNEDLTSTGTATLTRANLTAGRHVLYVRSMDAAGNPSSTTTYTFFAGTDIPATPMATWRFEGDTADDTGEGHHLTQLAGDTVTYTTDRDGRPASALALDGSTCLHTGDGVIFTSGAYSLAAWVRLDEVDNTTERPLAQIGDTGAGFQMWYSAGDNRWYFSVLDANQNWYSIGAAPTAALGEWEHIAATYDPDAALIRLYLGGNLVGERAVSFTPWNADSDFGVGCKPDAAASTAVNGAIDQVGVWQGLLSQSQIQAAMIDLPGATIQADWTFKDDGTDDSVYGRHLNTDNVVVGTDPFNRPSGELELDNFTCLEYPGPIVATDRSVTIASWVKFNRSGESDTIVALAGANNSALLLRKLTSDQIQFRITSSDALEDGSATAPVVWSRTTPVETPLAADKWYHVTGVYDSAAGTMSLYLNGELSSTRTVPQGLWKAEGPTLVGCSGRTSDNYRTAHLDGSLHGVSLWRGAVDATQIAGMMGNPPADGVAWWDLDSNGDEWTDNGHGLTLVDNYSWVRGEDGTRGGALAIALDGGGYAHTAGPVVETDESFTIAAWVNLDSLAADQVAVSIAGASRGVIDLKYSHASGSWEFAAPPDGTYGWRVAEGAPTPVAGVWTRLVGVYDLRAGELRLYVDGVLAGTATGVVMPASAGPVVIGAELNADGTIRDGLVGAVDRVQIWLGALPSETIAATHPTTEV
ncbi:LamG-like jellyroll fold domain-containing protein [Glycomyces algeriensis]|uniref:LamG-like jellyroll fold domain-containing protein n=1 Tax=Glycomyces algeriensis TaxID=256037 RepID=UPI0022D83A10|nr:LamG-like jellyroll fold domain-containing protein [Glycomyces algeriensis]MDA1365863.1 hypothetical protein [Glycomyces algeriensis]